MSKVFSYPPFYHLPPFYTLQPVLATREKQIKLWSDLILSYCQHNNLQRLTVDNAEKLPLFHNDSIKRHLSRDAIFLFLDSLATAGRAEWQDQKKKDTINIYWRTPSEWADIIQKWASDTGYANSVLTVYELIEGDTGENTEFHNMDGELFRKAIAVLERRGKAELFQGSTSDEDGVKFLNV